jgi:hypothetical protein
VSTRVFGWGRFVVRAECRVLAALSLRQNFSVGCYCEDEARCHRGLLKELLRDAGAALEER